MSAVTTKLSKTRFMTGLGVAAALGIGSLAIAVPAAQAATYTYADARSTPENQARSSVSYATISGGQAWASLGLGTTTLITYYPAPGYSEVGYANGSNPVKVNLGHAAAPNARSKCFWSYGGVGGNVDLTCKAFS